MADQPDAPASDWPDVSPAGLRKMAEIAAPNNGAVFRAAADEIERLSAAGAPEPMRAHVEQFATRAGWNKDEGEGAFEFVQRKCYHQGWQDGRREALGDVHRDTPEVAMPNPVGARAALAAQPEPAAQDKEDAERLSVSTLTRAIQSIKGSTYNLTKDECIFVLENLRDDAARAATKPQGGA